MGRHDPWRIAFARQALGDLAAREILLTSDKAAACQALHFLQMAAEKVCKAYLIDHRGAHPNDVQSSHAHIAKQLPAILREQLARRAGKKPTNKGWLIHASTALARRIELLAPAVDDGGRTPANVEYPWADPDGSVIAPVDHNFGLDLLYEPAGRHVLKALQVAAEELATPASLPMSEG